MPRIAASERDAFYEARRTALSEVALKLWAEQGFDQTSVAAIAQQAGIAVDAHMGEGMLGWKQAGLATLQIQPSTGQMILSKS